MRWSRNSLRLSAVLIGLGQTEYAQNSWWRDALFELNSYASSRPAVGMYVAILLIYIVAVLPGLFLFLKKKDRMHYLRELLTVVAILFSALIFVLGAKTRLTAPTLNYVRVLEYGEDAVLDEIYISVQLPYRQEVTVDLSGSYEATALSAKNANGQENAAGGDYRYELGHDALGTQLLIKDSTVVMPMYFLLFANQENTGGIAGQLSLEDGTLSGALYNTTGLEFRECVLLSGGRTAVLGACGTQLYISDAVLAEEALTSNGILTDFIDSLEETEEMLFVGICDSGNTDFIRDGDRWNLSGETIVVAPVTIRNGG